jgi:hypothetical protein
MWVAGPQASAGVAPISRYASKAPTIIRERNTRSPSDTTLRQPVQNGPAGPHKRASPMIGIVGPQADSPTRLPWQLPVAPARTQRTPRTGPCSRKPSKFL